MQDRQTRVLHRQTYRLTKGLDILTDGHTYRQTDKETHTQIYTETDTKRETQTWRHRYGETYKDT
jgi:hypothetical protein